MANIRLLLSWIILSVLLTPAASATPFTTVSPDGTVLPSVYPEAGGVALILYGANGNIYYQFSDPAGAFVGFQENRNPRGQPAAFRGNPFTINNPLLLDCGVQSCDDYFSGQIVKMEVRFTAADGDTQQGGFDEDDISLLINGVNIGNWSDVPTQNTNTSGTALISSQLGFGNQTFDTGWFNTTDAALLSNILTTQSITTQVRDEDPDDNYWNFRTGNSLGNPDLARVAPAYTLDKRARSGSFTGPEITTFAAVGETVFYTYDVRNVGSVRINNLEVEDDRLGAVSCNPTTIEIDSTAVCQESHVVTQEEFDAQAITNVAVATGEPEFGQLGTLSDTVTLTGPGRNPGIDIVKTPKGGTYSADGETINYAFVVTNTGDVTLSNVVVTDPLIPTLSCAQTELAPNGTLNCSFAYSVTQDNVDDGAINNRADVTSIDPAGTATQDFDTATNTAVQDPDFSVTKSTPDTPATVGQTLTYNFAVRNDGNVSIRSVTPVDLKCASAVTLASGDSDGDNELDVGDTHTYTCTSQALLQEEIDAGTVNNTVNVTGAPAGGTLAPISAALETPITRTSGFDVVKSTSTTPVVDQPMAYSFVVTNTGNASISSVVVTDAKCLAAPQRQSGDANNDQKLNASETWTYTCTSLNVTQDEVDNGTVNNTVTVNGTGADGTTIPTGRDVLETPVLRAPDFSVLKTTTDTPTREGDRLTYNFALKNDGNVTIFSPVLTDAKCASAFTLASGDSDGDGALDVGETHNYTCQSVPVTQLEVDNGQVVNNVTVTGTPAGGPLLPTNGSNTTLIAPAPELTLDKRLNTASPTSFDGINIALLFDFVVTNTGNITITAPITITDPLLDAPANCPALPSGGLAPDGSITCTGSHTTIQQDIDDNQFVNTATASSGGTTSDPDSVTVAAVQEPSLALVKTATDPPLFILGAQIDYSYVVTNDGNTTIPESGTITVNDNRTGVTCDPIPTGGLLPTNTLNCSAQYFVSQTDLNLGTVTNTATATDGNVTSPTVVATIPSTLMPALGITKTVQPLSTDFNEAGDIITYQYEVQNTGGASFSAAVLVSDNKINGGTAFTCWAPNDASGNGANLDPDGTYPANTNGETAICTADYAVTQADIDAGSVDNEALAQTIFGPGGAQIPVSSAPAVATATFTLPSSMTVAKVAAPADLTTVAPGSVITYTFTLTNTGEVTLNNAVPVDGGPTFGGQPAANALSAFTVTGGPDSNTDGRVDTIAPDDAPATVTATYVLTQQDIDNAATATDTATSISNTATGTAIPAVGTLAPVVPSIATTGFTPEPAFLATKSTASIPENAGDTLDYTFSVENTGNVTITGLTLVDGKCDGGPNFLSGDLNTTGAFEVDEIWLYSCTSVAVTQDEVDSGEVENTVTVSGTPAGGNLPDTTAETTTEIEADGKLDVAKSTNTVVTSADQTLQYTFVVTNPGNVSITPGVLDDPKCAAAPALQSGDGNTDDALNPTETWTYTCTSIPVTQAEIDAGLVINTVSVPGTTSGPGGVPIDPPTATVETPVTAAPDYSVTKATASLPSVEGQELDYTFTVVNDGNVSIGNLILTDAKCQNAPSLQSGDANGNSRLEPTETFVYTCTSVGVTQAELDAGEVINTVGMTGNAPNGSALPADSDTLVTDIDPLPSFRLGKTTNSAPTVAGETLIYDFTLVNDGNVTISDIVIDDAKCAAAPVLDPASDAGGDVVLSPAEEWALSCTSILVTQAEVDLGTVENTAIANGNPPGGTLDPSTAGTSTNIPSTPGVNIAKTTTSTPTVAGATLVYDFVVTNTGNTSLPVVTVTDAKCAAAPEFLSGDTIDDDALNPTETWVYQCTSIPVLQTEVDAGQVVNEVTVAATDTLGNDAPADSSENITGISEAGGFSVVKSTTSTPTEANETLEYTFTVSNDGNVSISDIVLTDAKCAAAPALLSGDNGNGLLDPAETFVYSCTSIAVTQDEVDAGLILNEVSVSGNVPAGDPLTPATGGNTTPVTPMPGIEAVKTITSTGVVLGDTVSFRIEVRNTGNVTLNSVGVDDTLTRADGTVLTLANPVGFSSASLNSDAGTLLPEEVAVYTASYVLLQEDIDAGGLSNTATATGTPPVGAPVTDVSDDGIPANGDDTPTTLVIPAEPELGLVKSLIAVVKADGSTASSFNAVGDQIDYLFTVTNSGNVTITDAVDITDPLITNAGGTITCEPVPLAPLSSLDCRGSYVIVQDDLDTGEVNNTASASDGTTTSPEDMVRVEAIQAPAIATTKVARSLPPATFRPGVTATYDYVTTNTGNLTLTTPIVIEDNLIDASGITCDPWPGSLLPGETYACVGTYTVTSEDVFLGVVTNLARGTDGTVTSPQAAESIPDNADPALSIVKTSPDLSTGFTTAGDMLTYNFTVTNSGERAFVRPVIVTDNRIGTITCFEPTSADPDFGAGEVAECSADYEVTQADLDAGFVTNEAFAETFFANNTTVVSPPDTVTIDAVRDPALVTTKTAALPAGRTNETLIAGDILRYTIEVANAGNLTLSNITISDPRLSLTCAVSTLAPQNTDSTCQSDYTVTQADIDAGQITNAASASGSDPQGNTVVDGTTLVTPMPTPLTNLVVRKSANVSPFGPVGSTIAYSFEVENAGNVTLRNVTLTDPRVPDYSCAIARLLPQEINASCATPYVVTQTDVDAGEVVNTATASGTGPDGNPVNGSGSVATPGPAAAGRLEATKIFSFDGSTEGANVTFSVSVANTGNVTLTNVVPVDTLTRSNGDPLALAAPGLSFLGGDADGDLALDVGEIWQYSGNYVLTQDDINAGGIQNIVDVTAIDPNNETVTDRADDGDDGDGNTSDDPTVFEIPVGANLEATKVISTTGAIAGDTVVFDIVLRNLGNVDLENITVEDDLSRVDGTPIIQTNTPQFISGDANTNGILNLSEIWTYQLSYTLTQGDIDAGGITNVATGLAQDESGTAVTDVADNGIDNDGNTTDDPTVLVFAPLPELTLRKSVVTAAAEVDEIATFLIEVENTGNVTLRGLTVEDTLTRLDGEALTLTSGPTAGPVTAGSTADAILPDGIVQYTATYQLVQDDIDAGGVANTVLGTATAPNGGVVTDVSDDPNGTGTGPSDPTVMVVERLPSLVVEKSSVSGRLLFPTVFEIGFQITIENDGNTILTDVQVQDDLAAFAAPAVILTAEFPTTLSVTGLTSGSANPTFDGVSDIGLLAAGATLARGETATFTIVTTYEAAGGFPAPGENTASATSTELTTPEEGVTIATNVDGDGDGVPDGIESNTEDRDGDGIPDAQDYDPTGYFYCEDSGRILSGGQITVTGNGASQTGVGSNGSIRIVRDGSSGEYQFFVTRAGSYQLSYTPPANAPSETLLATTTSTDVTTLRDVLTGTTTTNPRILGSGEFGNRGTLTDFSPAANPAFYTTFVFEAGDPVVFSNNIPFQCTSIGDLVASKAVLGASDVRLGDNVTYQLTYELSDTTADLRNLTFTDLLPTGISYVPDSAQISRAGADATPFEPIRSGRSLTWAGEMMTAGTTTVITFNGRVGPNAPTGNLVNRTFVRGPTGEILSNLAEAIVRRVPEHVFDCSDVIGTVFDDVNRNGYQDGPAGQSAVTDQDYLGGKGKIAVPVPVGGGEGGIPDVRIATVNGTLITTDAHGRFHVPCAELPSRIGTNFLLKVDERSLPSGYRITTENPRVVRLTAGKFAKMNFGATIGRVIDINLSGNAFGAGTEPTAKLQDAVRNLARTLQSEPSVVRLAYVAGSDAEVKLGRARMRVVEKLLKAEWRRTGTYKLTIEKTIKQRQGE